MSIWRETPPVFRRLGDFECLQRVTSVSLHGEKVTDAVVPHLIKLRQLRSVKFGPTTALSANGIEIVKAALPDCEIHVSAAIEAVTSL